MNRVERVLAVSLKEWRLNLRFPMEYFAGNLIGPLKGAILMCLIYSGFLKTGNSHFGMVSHDNYALYVIIGTTCHSLFSTSIYLFANKMAMEKWWQTVLATLISPASAIEVILGFLIGSGGMQYVMGVAALGLITFFHPVSLGVFLFGLLLLFMLAMLGFGIGLLGATMSLCFEGQSFLFNYSVQGLVFASCFYYPIELLPTQLRWIPQILPSYHMVHLLHQSYLVGFEPSMLLTVSALFTVCVLMLILPALFFDYAVRKFGIVGY